MAIDARTWTDPTCPVSRTADLVGDRWSLLIVRDAMDGARSFTDFRERTGIARNILTDRLRRLTEHGLMTQVDAPTGARKQYVLTPRGKDLFPVIVTLRQWGERYAFADDEPHSILRDDSGNRVPQVAVTSGDGAVLTCDNTRVDHRGQQRPSPHPDTAPEDARPVL